MAVYPYLFRVLRYLHYNDFGKFYYSMVEWRDSGLLYGPNPATLIPVGPGRAEQFWNMNPPHFHFLIWPLTFFPIARAYLLWAFANVTVLVIAIIAIARTVPIRAGPAKWFGGSILAIASAPALSWAVTGQLTGLLVGAVTWIWLDLRSGRWIRAALMIGVVTSMKPFLVPLGLYLVFRRQWRAVFLAGVTLAASFVAGVTVFGVQAHRDWLHVLGDARWTGAVMNASIYAVVSRAWSGDVFVEETLPNVVGSLLAGAVFCVGVFGAWRALDADRRVTRSCSRRPCSLRHSAGCTITFQRWWDPSSGSSQLDSLES